MQRNVSFLVKSIAIIYKSLIAVRPYPPDRSSHEIVERGCHLGKLHKRSTKRPENECKMRELGEP